jgi:hypothetical protein
MQQLANTMKAQVKRLLEENPEMSARAIAARVGCSRDAARHAKTVVQQEQREIYMKNEKASPRLSVQDLEEMTADDLMELLSNIGQVLQRLPQGVPLVQLQPIGETDDEEEEE